MRSPTDPYANERHDIEDWFGPLIPSPEELHDHRLALLDRADDYTPSKCARPWMTPGVYPVPEPLAARPPEHTESPSGVQGRREAGTTISVQLRRDFDV